MGELFVSFCQVFRLFRSSLLSVVSWLLPFAVVDVAVAVSFVLLTLEIEGRSGLDGAGLARVFVRIVLL